MSDRDQNEPELEITDEAELDDTVPPDRYDITSYGADFDAEGLVKRLSRQDIIIPPFQRDYVWTQREASRFIESLLLGLPVPGIFLARDGASSRLLVIDGQQRLKTLQFFIEGYFNPSPDSLTRTIFKLKDVQEKFDGKSYDTLEGDDRVNLRDSIIHATIIKQDSPEDDDTSVYHIFERLNTGGRRLTPQQIRSSIYHGSFLTRLKKLNELPAFRAIAGPKNRNLKDEELILRFFALYYNSEKYQSPMNEFLNKFAKSHKDPGDKFLDAASSIFERTIATALSAFGDKAFRLERVVNAAVFDSVMVGLARRLKSGPVVDNGSLSAAYLALINDQAYFKAVSQATSNEPTVAIRLSKATEAFRAI